MLIYFYAVFVPAWPEAQVSGLKLIQDGRCGFFPGFRQENVLMNSLLPLDARSQKVAKSTKLAYTN